MQKEVFIVSAARTPIGSFNGALSQLSAIQLGVAALKGALERSGLDGSAVQELFLGNVFSAGLGQAPATQVAKFAGLGDIPATSVNKVCASGMKAVAFGAQAIALGDLQIAAAGGAECMSKVPYYLEKARAGYRLGHAQLTDGLIKDGLWDVYNDFHMGSAAELCAQECGLSREQQDSYAIESYKRAQNAQLSGKFAEEITPVTVTDKKGKSIVVQEDEELHNVHFEKIPSLKPVFEQGGTVTAANASTLNDGAAFLILASAEAVEKYELKPLARILGYADAQQAPQLFTTSPAKAIPLAIQKAKLTAGDIDFYEINEAFSAVALANNKLLNLDATKVNVNGGAVALGHPLGVSGTRILVTLIHVLKQNSARFGVAGICNGGGGASAMVIENLNL